MKIFYMSLLIPALLLGSPVSAEVSSGHSCEKLCMLYMRARPRAPRPTVKPLVCVNFTLPGSGGKVTIAVSSGATRVIDDSKTVSSREAQFCYPRDVWLRAGREPDKVYLCSEHHVTVHDEKLPLILSGRGTKPRGYACLRGVEGCGGDSMSVLMEHELDR